MSRMERVFREVLRWLWMPAVVAPCVALAASTSIDLELMRRAREGAPTEKALAVVKEAPKPLVPTKWQPPGGRGRAGELQGAANNTPGTATYLDLNTQVSDTLDVADEQDWYYVHVPNGGKVTAFLSTVNDANLDYDLYAYRYNPVDGMLTQQAQSLYGSTHYEQVSVTAAAGEYYFFMVHAYQGADPVNPYTLMVLHSTAPDADEPDDNPWQAKSAASGLNRTRTLDNAFDEDWAVFNVSLQNVYKFSLSTTAAGNYQLQIFGANAGGAPAAVVNKNSSASYSLPPGTWYVRVLSLDTVDPGASYTVRAGVSVASLTLDRVDTESGNGGFINYGYGNAWRVRYFATFVGSVRDMYGLPVPNAPIDITVFTPETYQASTSVSGASDASGNFSITVNLPHAWGRRTYQIYTFRHYYDLASYTLTTGGGSYSNSLYHFAHSIYSP